MGTTRACQTVAPKEAGLVNDFQSHRAPWLPRQSERCNYRSYGTVQSSSYLPYQAKPNEGSPTHPLCHRLLWAKGRNHLTLTDSAGTQSNTVTLLYLFGGRETRVFLHRKAIGWTWFFALYRQIVACNL